VLNFDTRLIEETIGAAALCARCIIRVSRLSAPRLNEALPRLIGGLKVASTLAVCTDCLKLTVVHRVVG